MADLNTIVDQLSELTVMEAAELATLLEEKWGVSAAAPVAVAAGGPAARKRQDKQDDSGEQSERGSSSHQDLQGRQAGPLHGTGKIWIIAHQVSKQPVRKGGKWPGSVRVVCRLLVTTQIARTYGASAWSRSAMRSRGSSIPTE